jgi:hypothetical protein
MVDGDCGAQQGAKVGARDTAVTGPQLSSFCRYHQRHQRVAPTRNIITTHLPGLRKPHPVRHPSSRKLQTANWASTAAR